MPHQRGRAVSRLGHHDQERGPLFMSHKGVGFGQRPPHRTYLRDGRAPIPASEATSRAMSANRARNTSPEVRLRSALSEEGLRGFKEHPTSVLGRPDVVFLEKRVAVFVNGCFWHRCPNCKPALPKSHRDFWRRKFKANVARDSRVARKLRRDHWHVLVIWECRLRQSQSHEVRRVASAVCHA